MKKATLANGVIADVVMNEINNLGSCTCPVNCDCRQKCSDSNAASTDKVKDLYAKTEQKENA